MIWVKFSLLVLRMGMYGPLVMMYREGIFTKGGCRVRLEGLVSQLRLVTTLSDDRRVDVVGNFVIHSSSM